MVNDALDVDGGVGVLVVSEALFPAGIILVAFMSTLVEGSNASSIMFTGLLLILAVLFDALLGSLQDDSESGLLEAIIGSSTLGNINSSLIVLASKANFPAALLDSALFLAILKSRGALVVFLACSPLIGALLFDAGLGVSESIFNLEGRGNQDKESEGDKDSHCWRYFIK